MRTGGEISDISKKLEILGFVLAARTTPPALYGSGTLVGASPMSLAEDIHDVTQKICNLLKNQSELSGNDTV